MKKVLTRSLIVILIVFMLVAILPFVKIETNAAGGVKQKLDTVMESYPDGGRWTGSFDGGSECYGFAKMVIYKVFGKSNISGRTYRSWSYEGISTSGMDVIGSVEKFSSSNVKSLLSKAKCGDALQFDNSSQHSMIVYSVESDGVWIYHCNWDGKCGIALEKFSFGAWNGRDSNQLTLLRANNYLDIDGAPQYTLSIKYDANGGIISGSEKTYNIYSVQTSAGLNMRSGAGTSYGVLLTIPTSQNFVVTSTATANGYTWGKTTYNDKTGWVVISEDWTKKIGTQPQTKYYLNSSDVVYKSSTKKVFVQEMVQGTTYEDGLYNASTFGITRTGYTFGGWGTTASGGTIHNQSVSQTAEKLCANVKKGNQTITLYAYWIPNTLSVYFNANGGSISSDTYKLSSSIVYNKSDSTKYAQKWSYNNKKENGLANASTLGLYKTGYTFAGWATASTGGTIYSQSDNTLLPTTLNSNIKNGNCSLTLYAQWVPNTLTVYHNANGGSISSDTYKLSSNVVCYKSDSSKYVHKWTYNQKEKNGLTNASTLGLYRTGYTFVGWGTSSSGGTIFDQDNKEVVPTSINANIKNGSCSITLYAIWEPNTLNVYYNANGASISSDTHKLSSNVVYNKSDSTKAVQKWTYNNRKENGLTNASTFGLYKTGYTFAGWGTKADGGTIYSDNDNTLVPTTLNANIKNGDCSITLYAQWVTNILSVYYNANGGSISSDAYKLSSNIVYNKADSTKFIHKWTYNQKQKNGLTNIGTFGLYRTGYNFVGWGTSSSGGTIFDQNDGDLLPTTINANIKSGNCSTTLYAIWKIKTYTVKYDANGGTGAPANQTKTYGKNLVLSSVVPTREGYVFLGWSANANDVTATYTAGGTYTQNSSCTLYAVWKAEDELHSYTVEEVITQATCTNTGIKRLYCSEHSDCGMYKEVEIPATGHEYGEWEIVTHPTCTTAGTRAQKCICGDTITESIERLEHNYSKEWTVDITPTCTETGSKSRHCLYCGDKIDVTEVDATGHNYIWTNDFENSSKTGTCSVCGDVTVGTIAITDILTFSLDSANTGYIVTDCVSNYVGDIIIPDEIDGLPVTAIGTDAFRDCTGITSVVIPDSVTSIGGSAFRGCTNLKEIDLPDNITSIPGAMCFGCTKLESVTIPNGVVSIGGYAFSGCTSLKTTVIPDSVTNIGGSVFANCKSLIVFCDKNSAADTYATANTIDCIHNTVNTKIDLLSQIIYTDVLGGDLSEIISSSDSVTYSMNTAYAGTGAVVDVMKDGALHSQYTLVVNGDTNGDSVCDVLDCFDVERTANGNGELSGVYAEAGDTNGDGVIDIVDYQAIVNKAVS